MCVQITIGIIPAGSNVNGKKFTALLGWSNANYWKGSSEDSIPLIRIKQTKKIPITFQAINLILLMRFYKYK